MKLQVIPQAFLASDGKLTRSYGILIDNKPFKVYETQDEVKMFVETFRELNGNVS